MKRDLKLILLILVTILAFILGVLFELDYRILTRRIVKYSAGYELEFYGGKDFSFFETQMALILTLIPVGFYFTTRKISSLKEIIKLKLLYLILIPIFYYVYCYLESQFIETLKTKFIFDESVLKYPQNCVNYEMILFLTIISTLISGLMMRILTKKLKITKTI